MAHGYTSRMSHIHPHPHIHHRNICELRRPHRPHNRLRLDPSHREASQALQVGYNTRSKRAG
jgi:hypothetical protein